MGNRAIKDVIGKLKSPFARFIYKKVGFFFLALFIAMSLVFFLPRLLPTDPVELMIARTAASGNYTPDDLAQMRQTYEEKFGLNEPLLTQYGLFWRNFLTMDFGPSFLRYPRSVGSLVAGALPWTIVLVLPVLPLSYLIGNYIGAKTAYFGGRKNKIAYVVTMYTSQAPYYWMALILVFVFGAALHWFPTSGAYSPYFIGPVLSLEFLLDVLQHYILPFLSLLLLTCGIWVVGMRSMTLYEKGAEYIQYARQLGFREDKLRKYAQRNAVLPQFTGLPGILGLLIGSTMLVEVVFQWPGIGYLAYNAAINLDYPLLQATFIFGSLFVLIGNLVVDIAYGFIDPRIRRGYVGG